MLASLVDGTEVLIRPIRASDKALLAAGLTRLSQRTVVRRFLTPKPSFTSTELRYLTEVDGIDHYALVAVEARRWDGDIVAVGRWAREAGNPGSADAAIVVCDALQGKGLGSRLATLLADSALRRGIGRIHADIHSDNPAAHALMRTIARRLEDGGHENGVHTLTAELAA